MVYMSSTLIIDSSNKLTMATRVLYPVIPLIDKTF